MSAWGKNSCLYWLWWNHSLGTHLKDSLHHSWSLKDSGTDAVWHIAGMLRIPMTVKILKDIKEVFKYSNLGPGGYSESDNLKENKLCQVFIIQILPENWLVIFATEGGAFIFLFSNSERRESRGRTTPKWTETTAQIWD